MRNAVCDALVAAALADPKVLLLTGDHCYALFDEVRKARPEQYRNCGIAEQNMVGVAAGPNMFWSAIPQLMYCSGRALRNASNSA